MKKALVALMTAAMLTGILGGVNVSAADGAKEVTVTYLYMDTGTGGVDYFKEMLEHTYENWEMKDEVTLNINTVNAGDSDYLTKLKLQLQDASQCGDIVFDDTFVLPADAAAGYLADITEYLNGYDEWNDGTFIEAVKGATLGSDGKYYGIPASTDSRGLVVNTHILEAAGLGADWAPKSWDEILDGCRTIKENCDSVIPMWMDVGKAAGEGTSMNGYEMLLYGTADGDQSLYDSESGKWVVSSEGILAADQFLVTLFEEGLTGEYAEMLDVNEGGTAADYMRNDQLGIWLTGSWFPGNYTEGGSYVWPEYADVIKFVPMPTQDGSGTVTMSGGWAWCIPELCADKDLAFEFLKEMMKPDNYKFYVLGSGNLPTKDMSQFTEITEKPFFQQAQGMLEEALFRPKNETYSTVSTYVAEMSENSVVGLDAQAAMDTFATSVTDAVGADNVITK